jgi:hypothetical protein
LWRAGMRKLVNLWQSRCVTMISSRPQLSAPMDCASRQADGYDFI